MAKKAKTTKKQVKQSIKEFKAWLAGIAEFQPDDWCPTGDQWKLIKERIGNLQDDTVVNNAPTYYQPPSQNQGRRQPQTLMNPPSQDGIGLETNIIDPNVIMPLIQPREASLPVPPIPTDTNTGGVNVEHVSSTVKFSGKSFKTPTDMSGNGYKSPFS